MNKLLLLISICLLVSFTCFAQIRYSSAQFAVAGDTFLISSARLDTLGAANFQLTGANYSWNYANLQPLSQSTDHYLSAQTSGYKISYTSACIAAGGGVSACNTSWNSLVNLGHQRLDSLKLGTFEFSNVDDLYYKTTSFLPINIVGMTFGLGGINFPLTFKYSRPDTVYRFPLAYGNQDSCLSTYAIDLTSLGINFTYKVSTLRVNHIEGWGALTTPYRTYTSTLKMKTLTYTYDTLIYSGSVIPVPVTTSVTYSWFDSATRRSVLSADGTVAGSNIVYNSISYIDTVRCLDPRAQFTPSPLVPYLDQSTGSAAVNFNNSSVNANKFSWNFGDTASHAADSSDLANPSHTYNAAGIYQVTLIACNSVCSPLRCDTITEPITVFDSTNTQSSFTYFPLTPCIGDTIKFTNTSLNANSYKWSFGDNTTSTLRNPKKVYSSTGTYILQLIAVGSVKSDTSYQQIQVSTVPVASISPTGSVSICPGDSVTLTASGGDYYVWSNGKSTTSIRVSTGVYTVTAYNNCGNNASAPVTVATSTVVPTISVSAMALSICPGAIDSFHAQITNGGSSPVYQWKKNGINIGASSSSYVYGNINSGDSIWCILTSSAACANPQSVSSNTIRLTVNPTKTDTIDAYICQGSTYHFNTSNLSVAGIYRDTLTGVNTCDSITVLNLSVKPIIRDTINAYICQGSNYHFNTSNLSVAGIYRDTLTGVNTCDSITVLNLTVKPIIRDTINAYICQGSNYHFNTSNLSVAGIYRDTLTGVNTCDSITVLNLVVKSRIIDSFGATICAGSSYTIAGHSYGAAGIYSDTIPAGAANGCDSVIILNLSVSSFAASSFSISICQGSSYIFNGINQSTGGAYTDTLHASTGCDSIVTLLLTVRPITRDTITASICEGGSYHFSSSSFSSSGIYSDTMTGVNSCDSITVLQLTVKPIARDTIDASICQGSMYHFKGSALSTSGIYRDTLSGVNTCDSIIVLYLKVNPLPAPVITVRGYDTLSTDSFTTYTWLRNGQSIGSYTQTIIVSQNGSYSVLVSDTNGCSDTSPAVNITGVGISSVSKDADMQIYPNPNSGSFILETSGCIGQEYTISDILGRIIAQQTIHSNEDNVVLKNMPSGPYLLKIKGVKTVRFIVNQ